MLWLLLVLLPLQDFHMMAQSCSAAATLHFFHSMNWVRDVRGASHIDIALMRQAALDDDNLAAAAAAEVMTMVSDGCSLL